MTRNDRNVDPAAIATQLQVLRNGGVVTIPARRSVIALGCIGAGAFAILGVVLMAFAVSAVPRIGPVALLSRGFVVGLPSFAFFGVWVLPRGIVALVRSPRLVLDTEGISEERCRHRRWELRQHVAWRDIEEFFLERFGGRWPLRGQLYCRYRLTPEAAARGRAAGGRSPRLQVGDDRRQREVMMARMFGKARWLQQLLGAAHRQSLAAAGIRRPSRTDW